MSAREKGGTEEVPKEEEPILAPPFGYLDVGCILFGIGSYIFDQVSDLWVALHYYGRQDMWYFALTLSFVIVPSLITTCFSIKWYIEDENRWTGCKKNSGPKTVARWVLRSLFHVVQFGQIWRYIETLKAGLKSRKMKANVEECRQLLSYEDSDAAFLRLFEAFMESGPQMILQMYVLSKGAQIQSGYPKPVAATIQVVSLFSSLVSMAWALAGYQRCLRFSIVNKRNLTWPASIVQFVWYAGTLYSRVLSMALFASIYPLPFAGLCVVHWLAMTIWIMLQKTNFCGNRCEEFAYNVVIGVVYIFCYFNVKDEPTRWKYAAYYAVTFAEGTAMMTVWFVYVQERDWEWYNIPALVSYAVTFYVGITFMLVFYLRCHPNVRALRKTERSRTPVNVTPTSVELETLDPAKLELRRGGCEERSNDTNMTSFEMRYGRS